MVTNNAKRARGRPKGFSLDEALYRDVEMISEHGYEGDYDVQRIAQAVNTSPNPRYTAPSRRQVRTPAAQGGPERYSQLMQELP